MDQKYEALFTPWKIGNVEIKNRIVMCPMGGTSLFGWFELTGCGSRPRLPPHPGGSDTFQRLPLHKRGAVSGS